MTVRKLGNTGLEVPPLALRTNVFSWTIDEPAAFKLLNAVVAFGLNFLDTADVYSNWVPGNGGRSRAASGGDSPQLLATPFAYLPESAWLAAVTAYTRCRRISPSSPL
jgi:aryl-alcohol dehydrogenase-like predicted oxidoreductase